MSEQSVLSFSFSRFLNELHLGKLSETVIVHGDAPHNRPRFLVSHLIGNRASFLCTKAPVRRIPNEVSGHQLTSTSVPLAEEGPGHCWPGQVGRAGWLEARVQPYPLWITLEPNGSLSLCPRPRDLFICAKHFFVSSSVITK